VSEREGRGAPQQGATDPGRYERQQSDRSPRFPGFDVIDQARHWDQATRDLVLGRLEPPQETFFNENERVTARSLLNLIAGQQDQPEIPVLEMVESRLAAGETDGWRYGDMPEDGQAWRDTLGYLDDDSHTHCGLSFAEAPEKDQLELIQAVQDRQSDDWHGLNASHVWSLWTRYACTALYAHPHAWNEIGFSGPAYPRGYKNAGVDKLEPFEVRDARPSGDPIREGA
jgi:Gluconate 2-dehydrogenase subunit 3